MGKFQKTSVDVYRRIQELFSFLFELGVIAQLYCRTTLCIDRAHHLSFRLSLRVDVLSPPQAVNRTSTMVAARIKAASFFSIFMSGPPVVLLCFS